MISMHIKKYFKRVIRSSINLILRNNLLNSYVREIFADWRSENIIRNDVVEVRLLNCRKSSFNSERLNILIPGLSIQHVFGGISTALTFFETLGKGNDNLRIIITDEVDFKLENNPNYCNWKLSNLEDDDYGLTIIVAGDRENRSLPVGEHDRFVATAWWTEVLVKYIQIWQLDTFKLNEPKKFIYLIQDFEPGFYPWSSRYSLAESTYHDANLYIAVINSSFLKSFFDAENYIFPISYVFEPSLHPKLRMKLDSLIEKPKKRRVLIYGRPGTERNAFQIIVMAIKAWVEKNPETDWEFVSVGEKHREVTLGSGKKIISLGKLSLSEYAEELSSASVGISLMISPHPSYPPLEMAAFGIAVITNRFKGKNLSLLNPRIVSLSSLNSSTLAEAIDSSIRLFESNTNSKISEDNGAEWMNYLQSKPKFEDICEQIKSIF